MFRTRYYVFEEFLVGWYDKLKEGTATSMTVFIQKEIEKYKVLITQLRENITHCVYLLPNRVDRPVYRQTV